MLIFFSACSTKGKRAYKKPTKPQLTRPTGQHSSNYKPKTKNWITTALYKEYKAWYRTPYKYGGLDLNGVDCSSLVQQVYKNAFNLFVPRTTKKKKKIGYKIDRNSAKEGDLILFKTGWDTRHSGVVIERGKFMHSSQKHGVIISSISNPYWRSKYWQTRRLLP